jgi:hypothetical protein
MRFKANNIYASIFLILGMAVCYVIVQYLYGVFTQPYFWDELGVYSRSSMYLSEYGLSLMPDSVPDELSRGHPLLCPLYFANAFKFFGCNPLTAHIAAAVLNSIGFLFVFAILLKNTKPFVAAAATLAIFVQALFLSQSLLILPEMPLMVFTIAAVYFYLNDKILLAALFIVLALQVKESALVLPFAFLVSESIIQKKIFSKNNLYLFALPILSFLIFIGIQKIQRGYFFYPLHTSLASSDPYYINERWQNFKLFFLYQQGHIYFVIALAFVLVLNIILKFKSIPNIIKNKASIYIIIVLGSIAFLVLNYFLSRYTLYFFIFIYIAFFLLVFNLLKEKQNLAYLFALALAVLGVTQWNRDKEYTDIDFSYTQHIQSVQLAIKELNTDSFTNKTIGMDFPISAVYWNSNNGFKLKGNHKMCPLYDSACSKDFILLSHPGNMSDSIKFTDSYTFYKELRKGYAFCRIYKKK